MRSWSEIKASRQASTERRKAYTRELRRANNESLMKEGIIRWNLQHDAACPDEADMARYLVALLEQMRRL